MDHQIYSPELIQNTASIKQGRPLSADEIDPTFSNNYIDLVSQPLGTKVLACSDEFFCSAANLLTPTPPIHKPNTFTEQGAWYDGWETRRHNPAPFDYVVFRLGIPSGKVAGVEIDTGFFSGNHAPEISVQGCVEEDDEVVKGWAGREGGWRTILGKVECGPKRRQGWALEEAKDKEEEESRTITHVRLCMWPDGGIGRFRLYGTAVPVFPEDENEVLDLAAMVNGGIATRCSDQHFGKKDNLLLPGRGKDMGDGWETKRSRGVHDDWVVIRLGAPCEIEKIVVDTAHFKGNFPQKVQLFASQGKKKVTKTSTSPTNPRLAKATGLMKNVMDGAFKEGAKYGLVGVRGSEGDDEDTIVEPHASEHESWVEVLTPQPCGPHKEHEFSGEALSEVKGKTYHYVKMVIVPDGGVKRLRVFGKRKIL